MAGDATGIIVVAVITATLNLPMYLETISEYVFGFAFGLLIFQELFMKNMLGGSYKEAVKRSLLPEWLSINMAMVGMIPVMVILMSQNMYAQEATSLHFWGIMGCVEKVISSSDSEDFLRSQKRPEDECFKFFNTDGRR